MHSVPFTGLAGPPLTSGYVEVAESVYDAGLEQPLHGHDPAYFTSVIAGAYRERAGTTNRVVRAGALLFHPSGEEHAVRFTARETHVFRVRPLAPMLEAARLARARFTATPEHTPDARRIVLRMREAYASRDALAILTIDGLACELIACYAGAHHARGGCNHAGARRARDVIEAQLNRAPSLGQLAAAAGCHPITLARAFRRTFGCSIGGYIRRRRLEQAARMLQHTNLPISIVALRSGFADQAHLTRALRQAAGRTPGALRAFKTSRSSVG